MAKKHNDWLKIAVVLAAIYFLSQVTVIYLPIILAVVISFILSPLVEVIIWLPIGSGQRQIPRGIAAFIAICLFAGLTSVALSFIFNPFVTEFNRFLLNLPTIIQKIQSISGDMQQQFNDLALPPSVRLSLEQVFASAAGYVVAIGQRILALLMSIASHAVTLVVVPVLTYYFLKDWRILRESTIAALPANARAKGKVIIDDMALAISGYLHGQALVSIIIGLMVFSGMYIMGVEYPLVLGLLATLTETIPIIGPMVGAAPAIFLAYLASPALAIKVLLFYLVIHQIENQIVVPKVMGTSVELHPVTVIIGLLVGGQLFGVIGMILAVPLLAIMKVLFKHLWHYD